MYQGKTTRLKPSDKTPSKPLHWSHFSSFYCIYFFWKRIF